MDTTLIKIQNGSFTHRNQTFYDNFNITITDNQHWVITGNRGAGKTVLVNALAGKYYPSKGSIRFPFLEGRAEPVYELKRKFIKVVSFRDDSRVFSPNLYFYQQRFNAFAADGTLTVWEYLMNAGFDERIKEHIDLIKKTGVFPLLDLERIKLSSGQSRRLLITKAILQQPKLLIIDNPYMGLDASSRTEFNELLEELVQTEGIQLVLVGHYQVLPACITHRLHLDNFEVRYNGLLKEYVESTSANQNNNQRETALLAQLQASYKTPDFHASTIFQLNKVQVAYYGKKILNHINWTVLKGEKWALLGDNGSGKSTLLSLLFGDHPQAYANDIYLFEQKRGMGQSIWDIKKNTGFTSPELHYFFSYELTGLQTVITGLFDHVYLKRSPTPEEQQLIDLLFAYFEITDLKERSFQSLSTGEQRLLLLIRALVKNPPLLLLDEPFQGFDLPTIEKAKRLLTAILTEGHTLVFISHYMEEIPVCVGKVAELSNGEIKFNEKVIFA